MAVLLWLVLALSGTEAGVVLKPVANLYSAPTEDADVVTQAIYGTLVTLVEKKEGWAKVTMPDEYSGWIPLGSIKVQAESERRYACCGRVAQVESLFANLYREPEVTRHQPLVTVPFETRLEVVAEPEWEEGRWLQVRLPDGRPGWIQRGDITLEPRQLSIKETVELARRFLGLPYFWGGTSTFGYDCSGFMQMLYRRQGVLMPRDAAPQSRWPKLQPVPFNKLRPGDLLYFGRSPEKITHTGMYIGHGQFINATTYQHPVVQISRLKEPRWTKLLVAARRLRERPPAVAAR
jgi:SH3-like domain-containing protein